MKLFMNIKIIIFSVFVIVVMAPEICAMKPGSSESIEKKKAMPANDLEDLKKSLGQCVQNLSTSSSFKSSVATMQKILTIVESLNTKFKDKAKEIVNTHIAGMVTVTRHKPTTPTENIGREAIIQALAKIEEVAQLRSETLRTAYVTAVPAYATAAPIRAPAQNAAVIDEEEDDEQPGQDEKDAKQSNGNDSKQEAQKLSRDSIFQSFLDGLSSFALELAVADSPQEAAQIIVKLGDTFDDNNALITAKKYLSEPQEFKKFLEKISAIMDEIMPAIYNNTRIKIIITNPEHQKAHNMINKILHAIGKIIDRKDLSLSVMDMDTSNDAVFVQDLKKKTQEEADRLTREFLEREGFSSQSSSSSSSSSSFAGSGRNAADSKTPSRKRTRNESEQEDADFALALELKEEEEERSAKRARIDQNSSNSSNSSGNGSSNSGSGTGDGQGKCTIM